MGTWLTQSVEHGALDFGVISLSTTWGVEIALKNLKTLNCVKIVTK